MDKDKMNQAHDIDVKITNYKSRISAINKSLEKDVIVKDWRIKITSRTPTAYLGDSEFTQDSQIDYDVLKLIKEEVLTCMERIKRIIDKEIAKLQTEFDNL